MLLGDAAHPQNLQAQSSTTQAQPSRNTTPAFDIMSGTEKTSPTPSSFYPADLSPLHATSAALIDATREILLDSDFENAMKVLTSWIPIKDENLLMRVVSAEWKAHKRKA